MLYLLLLAATCHVAGAFAYAWWIKPDIQQMQSTIAKLEQENERYRKYILRDFKFKVFRNGVEVDPDE
jgi:hypothetical protein